MLKLLQNFPGDDALPSRVLCSSEYRAYRRILEPAERTQFRPSLGWNLSRLLKARVWNLRPVHGFSPQSACPLLWLCFLFGSGCMGRFTMSCFESFGIGVRPSFTVYAVGRGLNNMNRMNISWIVCQAPSLMGSRNSALRSLAHTASCRQIICHKTLTKLKVNRVRRTRP
jgi:hypothetical protein